MPKTKATRRTLADALATKLDLTVSDGMRYLDACLDCFREAIINERQVELRGFGSFRVQERSPRAVYNPRKKQTVQSRGGHTVLFRPARRVKQELDGTSTDSE